MDRFQGITQFDNVDLLFRSAMLEARLRFSNAVLDGFHLVTANKRPPRSYPMGL